MKNEVSRYFINKQELAKRYNINLKTFKMWLDKIKDEMSFYDKKQQMLSPAQIKLFESKFCEKHNFNIELEEITQSLYKNELAHRYGISLKTFGVWVKKIEKHIPFYVKGQTLFCPTQIKYIESVLF